MRDLALLIIILLLALAILRTPWFGVLGLAFFGYSNLHRYAWGFMASFPAYQLLLAVSFLAWLFARDRQPLPRDWRIPVFYLLWFWFFITTLASPLEHYPWVKLWDVSKVYIPLILTLTLITTRERLFWLLATMGFSFGILAAKGGLFALASGFQYRVWGPSGTMYGGNNEFSIATLAAIPLLLLVVRRLKGAEGWRKWIRRLAMLFIPLSFFSAISSWSRGALLALVALVAFLLWQSRRKVLLGVLVAVGIAVAPVVLPEAWFERMGTIKTYEEDSSAMGRIEAWTDGLKHLAGHPLMGAGFDGWRYVTKRDWHSAYVEILVEHGIPGAIIWGFLVFGTWFSLSRLRRLAGRHPAVAWAADYAAMLQASMLAYMVGALTLGITYWDLLYQLIFCAVLLKMFVYRDLAGEQKAGRTARMPVALAGASRTAAA